MNDVLSQATQLFYDVGGSNWKEDLAMGGAVVILFLLLVIVLIVVYLSFSKR